MPMGGAVAAVRPNCTVPGCGKPHKGRGLCNKHYKTDRYRRLHPLVEPEPTLTPELLARFPILGRPLTADDIDENFLDRLTDTFLRHASTPLDEGPSLMAVSIGGNMADIWMPGVTRLGAGTHGWQLEGGTPKAVWHSTENNPEATAHDLGQYLINMGYEPQLVWNPWTGETVQLIPANIGGSALVTGNNSGSAVIQIECIGKANNLANGGAHNGQMVRPLTDSPMVGFGAILAWLDSFGISRNWPAGPPLASGYGPNPTRQVFGHNSPAGHYSHSQIPGNDHGDPGSVNVAYFGGAPISGGDPFMAVLEGLAFDGSHKFTHDDNVKVDLLQRILANAGGWIEPFEKELARPWAQRYETIHNVLGSFQVATKTGNPDGTADWIVGPATAAALCKLKKVV